MTGRTSKEDATSMERAKGIRLLLLDVDGVLTDGRIIFNDEGVESKQFDVKDGHGLKLLMHHGIEIAIISGRTSRVVEHRAADLGIEEVYQGVWDKEGLFLEIIARKDIKPENVAYMGDDIVDVKLLRKVGLAAAPADAVPQAREVAHYVSKRRGGRGAVRELCELILEAKGLWPEILSREGMR